MLDPVDETFFEFVEACLNHVQTPVLQRKFAALGGIDLLVRLCAMSMNDDVIVKACRAIAMLLRVEGSIPDTVPHSPSTIATASSKPLAVVNALKIRAAGGVAALLAQMRRSRNELVLQVSAGAPLRSSFILLCLKYLLGMFLCGQLLAILFDTMPLTGVLFCYEASYQGV